MKIHPSNACASAVAHVTVRFITLIASLLFLGARQSTAATYYEVWRNTINSSSSATRIAGLLPATSFDDYDPSPGTIYYYWIKVKQVDVNGVTVQPTTTGGLRRFTAFVLYPSRVKRNAPSEIITQINFFNTPYNIGGLLEIRCVDVDVASDDQIFYRSATTPPNGTPYWWWNYNYPNNTNTCFWTNSAILSNYEPSGESQVELQLQVRHDSEGYGYGKLPSNGDYAKTVELPVQIIDSYDSAPSGVQASTSFPDRVHVSWNAASGISDFSSSATGRKCTIPSAPTGVTASDGSYCNFVRVTWNSSSSATAYEVYRDGSYLADTTSTSYDDYPGNALTHAYTITAKNSCGTSGFSSSNSGFAETGPAAPGGVSATDGTYIDKVVITWNAVSGATAYEVWRGTSNNSGTAAKISNPDPTGTSYDDFTATPGTTFWYWVKAKQSCGTSGFSNSNAGSVATPANPVLSVSTSIFTPSIVQGENAGAQSFEVWNSGPGTLSYTISDDASWLSVNPTSGTSFGEHDTIQVLYDTSLLVTGTYTATITINAPGASGSPQTIGVTLTVIPNNGYAKPFGRLLYYTSSQIKILDTFKGTINIVPLPALPSIANPSWSPDGNWIVFNGGQHSQSQIHVVKPDGTNLRQVTSTIGNWVMPDFSPDGSQIAFHQVSGYVYLINFDGTGLTNLNIRLAHIKWSPIGRKIAGTDWAVNNNYDSDIFVYDLDAGITNKLTTHAAGEAYQFLEWSPDGTKLAASFAHAPSRQFDIVVMNADGSNPVNLTADWPDSNENMPTWTPDGKMILFTSNRSGNSDIWAMRADGTGRTNITYTAEDENGPAYLHSLPMTFGSLLRQPNGSYQLNGFGWIGRFEIQATTNFINWTPIGIVTNTNGVIQFTDTNAHSLYRQFYRGLMLPINSNE